MCMLAACHVPVTTLGVRMLSEHWQSCPTVTMSGADAFVSDSNQVPEYYQAMSIIWQYSGVLHDPFLISIRKRPRLRQPSIIGPGLALQRLACRAHLRAGIRATPFLHPKGTLFNQLEVTALLAAGRATFDDRGVLLSPFMID
jgi:hypothetical protein